MNPLVKKIIISIFFGTVLPFHAISQEKPNILWLVCEDISPYFSFYNDSSAKTPNLNMLASQSMIFDNAFATVGVCGPARSSIITGMYPTSIGTMHMRTGSDVQSTGRRTYGKNHRATDINGDSIIEYSAVVPDYVKCFTEYLRAQEYFCTNNQKTDYQFAAPESAFDENHNKAHWKNRKPDQPFFSIFNFASTHESRLFPENAIPLTVDPTKIKLPPYLPDTDSMRMNMARVYSAIEILDKEIGRFIAELKQANLYENTIIFFYSDHGGPLPRQKREVYDSGLKIPLLIKMPNGSTSSRINDMVSFVDFAPTVLSLAHIKPPKYMNGQAFLGKYKSSKPRSYIFGSADRFDEYTDRVRAIRSKDYLLIQNAVKAKTGYKDIKYRLGIPGMQEFLSMQKAGLLTGEQLLWFQEKSEYELYDVGKDPHQIKNLSEDAAYAAVMSSMIKKLEFHLKSYGDRALVPEKQMINTMWPQGVQPITQPPILKNTNGIITLSCPTKGASISYKVVDNNIEDINSQWNLYTKPVKIKSHQKIVTFAERIGYKKSVIVP